jgi:Xaa-Pro aminopeptidase
MGYPSCGYRTFVVGREPTAKEKEWYKRVKDTVDAAIEVTRVGKTTADAAKVFPPASKWGYKDEAEVLTVEFGHGLGMPVLYPVYVPYAMPNINRQWSLEHPQPFEKGMVIAYESLEGEHRVGGVRLEHMVVVTDGEAEVLDHFPRDEIIVVG